MCVSETPSGYHFTHFRTKAKEEGLKSLGDASFADREPSTFQAKEALTRRVCLGVEDENVASLVEPCLKIEGETGDILCQCINISLFEDSNPGRMDRALLLRRLQHRQPPPLSHPLTGHHLHLDPRATRSFPLCHFCVAKSGWKWIHRPPTF